jgi:hypothetical protein
MNSFGKVKSLVQYCLSLFLCVSCGKGGGAGSDPHNVIDTSDTSNPSVIVNTPTDDQVFASGSSIDVTGTVSDNSLYQGSITIKNDANGLVMKDQYYEIHYIPSYNFSMSYVATVNVSTDYTITVKFEDHGHNQTVKTIKVKVNP